MDPSNPSGLPDDGAWQERLDAYEAEQAKLQERIDFIAPAFSKLTTSEGDDLEATIRGMRRGSVIEFGLSELEQIARRIADLNTAVMAGSLVNEEAVSRAQVAEAEAAAAVRTAGARTERIVASRPNLSQARTERQKRNRERGPDVDSPL